ncbi:hypothetical protein MKK75_10120 [Methylobacterium sp. J-030]|uniref:hypothetical protein n=1 Tax=Methylobacterium sp. J-030 TaxID=2836627 RepID=UPI001FB9EFEC|nr:hypothetical protein [Methylobacterium sp. J-030]MCJ2069154.1 hypothetical protein [Methylobacterium sp. J-030]
MAVRFPIMKYVRSTLATTVLAVFGLGVAVQNLHSHDRDTQARPAAVAAVTPVAWVDPPARGTPETTEALASAHPGPSTAAAIPPATTALPAEPPRRRAAIHRGAERSRVRTAHLRRPVHAHTAAVDPAAIPRPAPRPAPDAGGRIDPIGDILRGLGFGRDG